jgi:hypothetical protein
LKSLFSDAPGPNITDHGEQNKCLACLQYLAHAARIIGCGPVQRDEDSPGAGG